MAQAILGISALYHDSAAALLVDGQLVAAAQEERFSRQKNDPSFPTQAIQYVLEEAALGPGELTAVAFYEKPFLKLERLLETYHAFAPRGLRSFAAAIPVWLQEKLFLKRILRKELAQLGLPKVDLLFPSHHLSHAASAFYPSPFEEAAILTVDGVGEWATTTIGFGQGNQINPLRELHFPHSLGLLYAAFTYYLGFRVNGGEYKLMGLAPYGQPDSERVQKFEEKIFSHLLDLRPDGSFLLNMPYFRFATGLRMTQDRKWEKLFGLPRREAESAITQAHHDLALAIQQATEKVIFRLAETARELTQCPRLVLAGGVALNSVANGKLLRSGLLDDLWIPPSPGDAGGAIGATYAAWHIGLGKARTAQADPGPMQQVYLGPDFSEKDIRQCLQRAGASYHYYAEEQQLLTEVASRLQAGQVVGWFQGRMEMGARALGNRSILADASQPDMQARLNRSIKRRESFRPFAPAVLAEDAAEYFELDRPSPYMQLVVPVREAYKARFPAITHVDGSARVQSVQERDNPRFWQLLQAFKSRTGTGMLVNTSFNVRCEPMVCSPQDAYLCYLNTDIDCLVMGNFLLSKTTPETKPVNPG